MYADINMALKKYFAFVVFGMQSTLLFFYNAAVEKAGLKSQVVHVQKKINWEDYGGNKNKLIKSAKKIPDWLLFRSLRSTIFQSEHKLSMDMMPLDFQKNMEVQEFNCTSASDDQICDISLDIYLRMEKRQPGFTNEEKLRISLIDDRTCHVKLHGPFIRYGSEYFQAMVSCHDLRLSDTSQTLVVLDHMDVASLSSWIKQAESSVVPFHLSVVGLIDDETINKSMVPAVMQGHVCVSFQMPSSKSPVIVCPDTQSYPKLHVKFDAAFPEVCPQQSQINLNKEFCALSTLLAAASTQMATSRAYSFVLIQRGAHSVCGSSAARLVQEALALRRAFSLIRCGQRASCLLLNARDLVHWSGVLSAASPSDSLEDVLFHSAHGLDARSRHHFSDRVALVTHSPVAERRRGSPARPEDRHLGPRCGQPLDSPAAKVRHEDDRYDSARCVPEVDFLSPCVDESKSVAVLQRPGWLTQRSPQAPVEGAKDSGPGLSVQVLANDRPSQLFRTMLSVVAQTPPQCVTVHLDSGSSRAQPPTDSQRAARIVARWFARAFGVRLRINADWLHPSLVRRLGVKRNYAEGMNGSGNLTSVDRLVHMTWNAVAHAFDGPAAGPDFTSCEPDATVVLEDDLLPAPDFIAYMRYGLGVMRRDPKVRVVSAWNDNGFNLRPGLQCAVQRGEQFMSLGWLTTRSVYDEITVAADAKGLWPTEPIADSEHGNRSDSGSMLRIING